ncbi:hypothetical protein OE09_2884 [Flavobacteriaceae bacterium MAR_2010_72]|nr:hypothetical protein OE09_2884 [Flavobacteriaceae bacterium MAR_2010_72]
MKPNLTSQLSCSVFGHNLYHDKFLNRNSSELTCATCHTKVKTNVFGEYQEYPHSNLELHKAFRKLFLLNTRKRCAVTYS